MSETHQPDRRAFLRAAAGGLTAGGMLGLGFDLRAAQAETRRFKFAHTREVPSICPYCAVGCSQLVSVREGKIVNIEGNPDSPVNRGTLCPKGAATYQLMVNPNRVTKVWYRAPGATDWDETKSLAWAMERIAQRVKQTRDATFQEKALVQFPDGPRWYPGSGSRPPGTSRRGTSGARSRSPSGPGCTRPERPPSPAGG